MKLNNGKNIITDEDITITGAKNLGNSLSDILQNQQNSLDQLSSELKWVYKYGGVGSGGSGGGGGGVSTTWSLLASLFGKVISKDDTVITLNPDLTTYTMNLSISGGTSVYVVDYEYGPSNNRTVGHAVLNAENNWRATVTLSISSNGNILITAKDNTTNITKTAQADYILFPYSFSNLKLRQDNDVEYTITNNDIYMDRAAQLGLKVESDYVLSVNSQIVYKWSLNGVEEEEQELDTSVKVGKISYNFPIEILEDPTKAGLYSLKLTLTILLENTDPITLSKDISFNLVPGTLYLKLAPSIGSFYDEEQPEGSDYYKYSINRNIVVSSRVYWGSTQNSSGSISYFLDDDRTTEKTLAITDGVTYDLSFFFTTEGWHKVTFNYILRGTSGTPRVIWVYTKEVETPLKWYYSDEKSPSYQNYWRFGEYKGITSGFGDGLRFENYITNTVPQVISIPNNPPEGIDFVINIGFQYNNINNSENKICSFFRPQGAIEEEIITIYQDRIVLSGFISNTLEIYLPKERNYDPSNLENYHLLTLSYGLQTTTYGDLYRDFVVYLDGVPERALQNWSTAVTTINRAEFYGANYSINLFEVSNFETVRTAVTGKDKRKFYDIDALTYYYTYIVKSRNDELAVSESDLNILEGTYDSGDSKDALYVIENDLVKLLDKAMIGTYSLNSESPTIVFTCSKNIDFISGGGESSKVNIFDWLNTSYTTEGGSSGASELQSLKYPVKIKWAKNFNQIPDGDSYIEIPRELGVNTTFYLQLQGSSTMRFKGKSFTLGLMTNDELNGIPVFSPNFKKTDTSTFLPETTFTLKGDLVDSSHTNNVCMGRFINENNDFSYEMSGQSGQYTSHIKRCLDGFPIMAYLEVITSDSSGNTSSDYYYLGIYNFNLGRGSYFNLGYAKVSELDNKLEDAEDLGFTFAMVDEYVPLTKFSAAEIQGNEPIWDFSQFQSSVLFENKNISGGQKDADLYMFGDLVYNPNNSSFQSDIRSFVRAVTAAGGYTFQRIGKVFEDAIEHPKAAYHIENTVPDYSTQYVRNLLEYSKGGTDPLIPPLDYPSLKNCILDDSEAGTTRNLNYESCVYYFVTCMAFGLVDSVQKNLTIKSWDGKTFGTFFYDMDTCLTRTNSGGKTSYFCFSDYWKTLTEKYEEEGKEIYKNLGSTIYRDYYPDKAEFPDTPAGYDIPSSYLFSIAKYAASLIEEGSVLCPQTVWASWRREGGVLENADKFIDNYYKSHLDKIPTWLISLNYRNKYLHTSSGTAYNETSWKAFNGRLIEETREWLEGRFHILDAYFNLRGETIVIYSDGSNTIVEPRYSGDLGQNPDIYITQDIFSKPGETINRVSGEYTFRVTAPDYSPLIHSHASYIDRFLLENSDKTYEIKVRYNGDQTSVFGGSSLWRSLDSINPFVISLSANKNFYLHSNLLEEISGNEGAITSFDFSLPSAKILSLNGSNYKGNLNIDRTYYNLETIDISNSGISLGINMTSTEETLRVKNLVASNINSDSLTLINCGFLENVTLANSSIKTCTLTPVWTSGDLNLSNTKIKSLKISGKGSGKLTINNSSLESIEVSGFKEINLDNCTNLRSFISNENDVTLLESVSLQGCSNLTNFSSGCPHENLKTLNFRRCSRLETIELTSGESSGFNIHNLETLDLTGTRIPGIIYTNSAGESSSDHETNILNISYFIDLVNLYVEGNPNIRIVKAKNDINSPIKVTTSFQGCNNLERIYGHYELTNNSSILTGSKGIFLNCTKFSVQGQSITTWKGKAIKSGGRVKTIFEILTNGSTNPSVYSAVDLSGAFTETTSSNHGEVTNLRFSTGSDLLQQSFRSTNCTCFDVYYVLGIFALSDKDKTISNSQRTDYMFSSLANNVWDWSEGNIPDKNMFYGCGKIQTLTGAFKMDSSVLPIHDGILSTLTRLQTYNAAFDNSRLICSKSIFSGQSNLETLYGFYPLLIVDSMTDEWLSYDSWKTTSDGLINNLTEEQLEETGNLTNIFSNTKITTLYTSFNDITTLYVDTLSFPSSIKIIGSSFRPKNAKGTLELTTMFPAGCKCEIISGSFIFSSLSAETFRPDEGEKVNMPITDSSFSHLTNLTHVGYHSTYGGSTLTPSFYGLGLHKYINQRNFPYDLLQGGKTKIKVFCGFFRELELDQGSVYENLVDTQIPGTLFNGCNNLEDVSALFYNSGINMQLSSGSFSSCSNLSNVSYMFYHDVSSEETSRSKLTGGIPYKFLFHGQVRSSKIYRGVNYEERPEVPGPELPDIQTEQVFYDVVNTKITSAKYLFYGCINLSGYENDTPEVLDNPDYIPFKWTWDNITEQWRERENTDKYTCSKLGSWSYTGIAESSKPLNTLYEEYDSVTSCNTMTHSGSIKGNGNINYFCSPDLLRYCSNTSSLDITYMFAHCGFSFSSGSGGTMSQNDTYYSKGLSGRIPPYLLKPVSNLGSIEGMFQYCRNLTAYVKDSSIYLIPSEFFTYATKISDLQMSFYGNSIPYKTDLNIFYVLKNSLDLRLMFGMCLFGNNNTETGEPYTYSGLFTRNTFKNISGLFSSMLAQSLSTSTVSGVTPPTTFTFAPYSGSCPVKFINNFGSTITSRRDSTYYVYINWGDTIGAQTVEDYITETYVDLTEHNNLFK